MIGRIEQVQPIAESGIRFLRSVSTISIEPSPVETASFIFSIIYKTSAHTTIIKLRKCFKAKTMPKSKKKNLLHGATQVV